MDESFHVPLLASRVGMRLLETQHGPDTFNTPYRPPELRGRQRLSLYFRSLLSFFFSLFFFFFFFRFRSSS